MIVGYLVTQKPNLASYRLRVKIPAPYIGRDYVIGESGDINFFYKLGNPEIAKQVGNVVFDVVNDHFDRYPSVGAMCALAERVTTGSEVMAEIVRKHTGRDATVIDDPYENDEATAAVSGDGVLWFGHSVNLPSLSKHDELRGFRMTVLTDLQHPKFAKWTPASEKAAIASAAVVALTGTNPGASSNRPAKAIRAGRFVVMPEDCAESWKQFDEFAWIGDMREGVRWALNNREEACRKIQAGQHYIRQKFSPQSIGSQWAALFDSI